MIYAELDSKRGESVIFTCSCHVPSHLLRLWIWDDMFSFEIALNPKRGVFRRIRTALKYVLGREQWAFEEVILNREEIEAFRDVLNNHLEDNPK